MPLNKKLTLKLDMHIFLKFWLKFDTTSFDQINHQKDREIKETNKLSLFQ